MTAHIFPENEAFIFDQRGHLVSVSRSKFGSNWPSVSTRKRTRKKRRWVGRFISRRQLPVRRSTRTERSGEPFIASVSQNSVFPFPRLGQDARLEQVAERVRAFGQWSDSPSA